MSQDDRKLPTDRLPLKQLPIWPDPVRGGPNALLRSALFAGIHSKKRQVLGKQLRPEKKPEGVTVASQDGIRIKFAGTQLNQYDADVFFEALHRARRHPLDTECAFKGADFLNEIGRTRNDLNYEDLDESLDRLRRGTLEVEWDVQGRHYVFSGGLIASYTRETTSKRYKVTFSPDVRHLFAPSSWTQLEWDERKALRASPLAQWLHSYFSTHAAPFPVTLGFLHEKSGSPTKLLKHFKTELKNAFASLEEKLGWEFTWEKDLVILKRPATPSQTRHLARKAAKKKETKKLAEPNSKPFKRGGDELLSIGSLLSNMIDSGRRK